METSTHRDDSSDLSLARKAALATTLLAACGAHATDTSKSTATPLPSYADLHFEDTPEDALRGALNHLQVDNLGHQSDGSLVSCMSNVTHSELTGSVEDKLLGIISREGFDGKPVHPTNAYTSNRWAEKRAKVPGGGYISSQTGPYTVCIRAKSGDEHFIPRDLRSKSSLPRNPQ